VNLQGISLLGPLPPAIQSITTFSAGVSANTKQKQAAEELIAFMAAPTAAETKHRQGMEPA
jgi:molybdate transport system substrate-binding protein